MTLDVLNLKDGLLLREQNELTMIQDVFQIEYTIQNTIKSSKNH